MTETEISIPDIGDYSEIPVIEISVAVGDVVSEGDTLIVLESDKATLDIPADAAGTVVEIKVQENDLVSEGSVILTMTPESEQAPQTTSPDANTLSSDRERASAQTLPVALESTGAESSAKSAPVQQDKPEPPAESSTESRVSQSQAGSVSETQVAATRHASSTRTPAYASPSVRRLASQLGVVIKQVTGTGPKNRITAGDINAFVKSRMTGTDGAAAQLTATLAALPEWPKVDFARFGHVERLPLSRVNKISGPALTRNAMLIPHVSTFDKSDVSEIEEFRKTLNTEAGAQDAKITLLAFAVKAVVTALKQYPKFNSSLEGDELVLKHYWNIGVAADTPEGLLVPVIKEADQKGLRDIANEMAELAAAAREGNLKAADMQGATFTISSLGGIGATNFTPIINAPEVAILGLPRSEIQPVWDGETFQPRRIQPLSLSFDHRVVDGVAAAYFLAHIAAVLKDFRRTSE